MKYNLLLFIISVIFFNDSFSQEKIQADINYMNFLGRIPIQTELNSRPDNFLRIYHYKIQPENYPKIGYMDTEGNVIVAPKYNMGTDFYGNYANIIKDSIYGYINTEGHEVLLKGYDEVFFYYGNTGIAKKNETYGLINRNGDSLTGFKYRSIQNYGSNHFIGHIAHNKNQILDASGKIIFNEDFKFNIASHYYDTDSLFVYVKEIEGKKLYGLVNKESKIICQPKYYSIDFINDSEFYAVSRNGKYGYINKKGAEIIPLLYDEISYNITENLIPIKKHGKWGFVNRKNEEIIPFMYDEAQAFYNGLAFVRKGDAFGCINNNNETVVEFNLTTTGFPFFTENMAVYKINDEFGFINKKGKIKIPTIYDNVFPFVDGLAYVELNGKAGFINNKGKEIIPVIYNQLWQPSEGIIRFTD